MMGEPDSDLPLLISAGQLAGMLNVTRRALWRLRSSGRLPRPVTLGRSVRWNRDEIRGWVEQGCPDPRRSNSHRPRPG
jgi:excisionase family DNA binding protein